MHACRARSFLQAISVAKDDEPEPPVAVGGGRHKTRKLHSAGSAQRRHGGQYVHSFPSKRFAPLLPGQYVLSFRSILLLRCYFQVLF